MTIKNEISDLINKSIKDLKLSSQLNKLKIFYPKEDFGDYSTNVAFLFKKPPMEIADKLAKDLSKNKIFKEVTVEKPGFINFSISDKYLQGKIKEIIKEKDKYGSLKIGKGKKVQVEFISANPTGPLTVANARGGPFGDVLANVFIKAGYKTEKAYYINDAGMQILTLGHSILKDEEAKYQGDYINELNKKIKGKDPRVVGEKAAKSILKMIKGTTDDLGIKYDEWFSEKSLHDSKEIDKVVSFFDKKKLTYEKEGAKWFKSTSYGDERDRVLVKSDGRKTYLAGDAAYHKYKFDKKKFDKVINIWGADHHGDIPGLMAVVEALGHKDKLEIVLLQFVTLFERGKKMRMSKRKGVYVLMDDLLKDIGSDIVRYFFLEKSANTHLDFDLSLAKEQSSKNPVYYIQYAHARTCSILKKINKKDIKDGKLDLLTDPSELNLIKNLVKFPEVIENTAKDYQIQRIPQYTRDLAEDFHQFYTNCKVITENKDLQGARLSLVLATKTVLKNTLDLMGISAPERM
jgi:arginyl-tRNA synthetase